MAESHGLTTPRKIYVKDLNSCLTCTLCGGYLIDATAVIDCSHTFCRACIVRHFESSRLCPSCANVVHKSKPLSKLRSDTSLQSLVYKMVPSLYSKELQRRADFYHSTGFRANSSCSDDSVLGDRTQDNEEWVVSNIGDPSLYFSPDDSISLSVEYYTQEEDSESEATNAETKNEDSNSETLTTTDFNNTNNNNTNNSNNNNKNNNNNLISDLVNSESNTTNIKSECENIENDKKTDIVNAETNATDAQDLTLGASASTSDIIVNLEHKRYLQCPAAVRMSHLMKFLRMKYALSAEHRVDIIYAGEVLPPYLSLMDVAYTFKWTREKPMRFFYLIYIPVLRPVVPQQPLQPPVTTPEAPPLIPPLKIEIPNNKLELRPEVNISPIDIKFIKKHKEIKIKEPIKPVIEDNKNEDNNNLKVSPKNKSEKSEKLLTNDSKSLQKSVKFIETDYKVKVSDSVQTEENCVYEYAEPDKDEIKAFAERRDREWALQKYPEIHVSKKRKKSKHSKNEFMHKKRKLHAEITSNEVLSNTDDSLKLKVKLSVANGHKHKHRSSSSSIAIVEPIKTQELSPKERLLQMRQVRHKHVAPAITEDKSKNVSPEPNIKMVITSEKSVEKSESISRMPEKIETETKIPEQKTPDILSTGKTLRSDFSNKTLLSKDICNKYVRVSLEKFGDKTLSSKKVTVNNLTIKPAEKNEQKEEVKIDGKTEIFPVESKNGDSTKTDNSNKLPDNTLSIKPATDNNKSNSSKILDKINTNKVLDNKLNKTPSKPNIDMKIAERNNLSLSENKTNEQKFNRIVDNKTPPKLDLKVGNKTNDQSQTNSQTNESKLLSSKSIPKIEQKSPIDESKTIENKLNSIDFKSSQSTTLVTKNFTVSKVESGKRKLDSPEITKDKLPSLEITVINLVSRPPQTSGVQTNAVQSKPISNTQTKSVMSISPEGPPAKKIRPPPLTIPLGRIQKMNNINKNIQKVTEKCDTFGALDLSKPTKPDVKSNDFRAHTTNPKSKIQDQIQSMIRPKTPIKTSQDIKTDPTKSLEKLQFPDKRPNISNLQMLSESAVQIRELMAKGGPITTIPNLIKKIPTPINQKAGQKPGDFLQKNSNFSPKTPNLIPKTLPSISTSINNFPGKTPNFLSKNLQKLPKLNEINKGQFCRLNSSQARPPRPAGQNQTVRNIPNPSLLVRQQNQNRINSLSSTVNHDQSQEKEKLGVPETEKRPSENKTSEPPPLKPIESFKK